MTMFSCMGSVDGMVLRMLWALWVGLGWDNRFGGVCLRSVERHHGSHGSHGSFIYEGFPRAPRMLNLRIVFD